MKHIWHLSSLKGSPRQQHEWMLNKRREFEANTGVGWTLFTMADKVKFRPYIHKEMGVMQHTVYENKIIEYLQSNGESDFVDISDNTGISLKDTMMLIKHMTMVQMLIADVDRSGKWTLTRINNHR